MGILTKMPFIYLFFKNRYAFFLLFITHENDLYAIVAYALY